ncbi:MAG: hypothetical protein ACP5GZ_07925 [Vulcanisaeta sp.]
MGVREEINTLIRRARDFLRTASFQVESGMYDLVILTLNKPFNYS